MPEEIIARYRWTLAELTVASRWHLRQRPRVSGVHLLCWSLAAVCGLGAVLAYRRTGDWYLVGWLLLGAGYFPGLLGLRRWLTLWRMRRNYAKSTGQDAEIEWRIREDLLRVKTPHASSEGTWALFNQAVQTPDGLLLYPQPLMFQWLPRHAFENEAAFDAVVEIVRRHVPAFRGLLPGRRAAPVVVPGRTG